MDDFRIKVIFGGFIMMLAGLLVAAAQAIFWLRNGVWHPVTVLDAWQYAGYSLDVTAWQWRGLAKLVSWAFNQSFAAALSVCGLCITWAGSIGDT